MNRRIFIGTIMGGLVTAPLAADAQQQAGKFYRIGMLWTPYPEHPVRHAIFNAFRQGLSEHGYVEGRNIAFEHRYARGKHDLFPDLAAELVRLKVDIIVGGATPAIRAAKQATSAIPIVMAGTGDPVGSGLVTSLARPGGNITGVSFVSPEIVGKQLQLLNEAVPTAFRVAVLWNPANPLHALFLKEAQIAGQALGVQLQLLEVRTSEEFDSAFRAVAKERAGALIVLGDAVFLTHTARISDFAAKNRLPAMYGYKEQAEAGGLMAYSPSLVDMYRRAATYVDKILKGTKPADLPVEQPTKFELVINLKTAKALGLTIPPSLLQRADEVIQ
jgi:putative ABC transport system substrate-binding protein